MGDSTSAQYTTTPENTYDEGEYLGNVYPYYAVIRNPEQIGMSVDGTVENIGNNAKGLLAYAEVLLSGKGAANIKCQENPEQCDTPLGDRYHIKTLGKCKYVKIKTNNSGVLENNNVGVNDETNWQYSTEAGDDTTKDNAYLLTRNSFVNNIPTGKLPLMPEEDTKHWRGLVPSTIESATQLNPIGLLGAMTEFNVPACVKIKYQSVKYNERANDRHDENDNEVANIAISDLKKISDSVFKESNIRVETTGAGYHDFNKINPFKREGFTNIFTTNVDNRIKHFSNNKKPLAKVYTLSIGLLLSYLLYKVLKKEIKL